MRPTYNFFLYLCLAFNFCQGVTFEEIDLLIKEFGFRHLNFGLENVNSSQFKTFVKLAKIGFQQKKFVNVNTKNKTGFYLDSYHPYFKKNSPKIQFGNWTYEELPQIDEQKYVYKNRQVYESYQLKSLKVNGRKIATLTTEGGLNWVENSNFFERRSNFEGITLTGLTIPLKPYIIIKENEDLIPNGKYMHKMYSICTLFKIQF